MSDLRSITVFIDYKSPYAYLAKDLAYELERDFPVRLEWRPYVLDIPSFLGSARVDGEGHVLEETRRLTNFKGFDVGSVVNLESSLRFGGKVGGHFVTGHIDATGEIAAIEPRGTDHYLRVRVPEAFVRYIVHKGSIAIDGISLTIAEVAMTEFAVWLIPHTMLATNLHSRRVGDAVNLEFDLLGKHVEKLLLARTA